VISYSPLQKNVPLRSVRAVVGGAICFAQALVLVRRFPRVHPVTMNAVGMTAGAAVLLAAAFVADDPIVLPHRPETRAAMAYLVVIGSVVVFPALPTRSPVLGSVTGLLRVRDHPVRHPPALSLAR
jgi:drug/metabolite transporter (DMT)-like permease